MNKIDLQANEARRLFVVGSELADLAEEILERRGDYNQEFIRSLKKSLKEAKEGKLIKLESILDIK